MTTMDDLITLPEEDFNNLMLQVASTVGKAARPKLESAFKQQRGLLSISSEKGTASLDSNAVGKRLFADDDIFTAAKGGNAARINELLSGDDAVEQVTEVDAKGFTALMRAAQYGRWAVIGNLLDAGADVEATQEDTQWGKGKTALILAASSYQVFNDETSEVEEATTEEDRVRTVKSLCFRGGAKISATDSDGKAKKRRDAPPRPPASTAPTAAPPKAPSLASSSTSPAASARSPSTAAPSARRSIGRRTRKIA